MVVWRLETRREAGAYLVTVVGELDMATKPHLITAVGDLLDARGDPVIIDLTGVAFIDACGLGALIGLSRRARARRSPMLLAGTSPAVRRILRLTQLEGIFPTASSRPEARETASGAGGSATASRAGDTMRVIARLAAEL